MDPIKRSIATGAHASISPKEGGRYSAHDDYIRGKSSISKRAYSTNMA